jgi:hypothetical protein
VAGMCFFVKSARKKAIQPMNVGGVMVMMMMTHKRTPRVHMADTNWYIDTGCYT